MLLRNLLSAFFRCYLRPDISGDFLLSEFIDLYRNKSGFENPICLTGFKNQIIQALSESSHHHVLHYILDRLSWMGLQHSCERDVYRFTFCKIEYSSLL
jgi:hypothetical protein